MVVMAEEFGADPRLVAFMQYLRVIIVTLTASLVSRLLLGSEHAAGGPGIPAAHVLLSDSILPLAATLLIAGVGAFAGQRLKIPSGALLVPLAIGASLQSSGIMAITIPQWLLVVAYGALGWYIGLRFNRETVAYALRTLPEMLFSTFILIGLCGLSAWVLTKLLHTDGLTAYLATSPGGLDSVAIIAVGSDANVPFVLALQTLRLLVVIITGPPLAKLVARSARGWRPGGAAPN
jgi:membrane AbrB-like protein